MRFRAEFDMPESDCSFCPCFIREGNDLATCRLADVRDEPQFISGILVPGKYGDTMTFPVPLDCPLEVVYVDHDGGDDSNGD